MGLLEVLTLIFVVCKLTGYVAWSWWLVFSPMYLYVLFFGGFAVALLFRWRWNKS